MDKPVLIIMCSFFVIGGLDYIFGSPLKLGNKFEEGIKAMGALALGIIGIYSLSPFLLTYLAPVTEKISELLNIDPSILPACIFPVDMGGYPISRSLANTSEFSIILALYFLGRNRNSGKTLDSSDNQTIPI